jgi:uncharacterized oligopeptide transporter (OPT) family protein
MIIGMGVAVIVIIADIGLQRRKARFRMPVLAVVIGFYLPLELSVPIFAGGLLRAAIGSRAGRGGILFASGLITGEALMGIMLAIPVVIAGDPEILAVADRPLGSWPGLVLLIAIGAWLAATASKTDR